jgi:general transcription factor 3C polypeptide 3 (transcription factor C subunit 4)
LSFLTTEYQFHNEPLRIIFTLANSIGFSSLSVLTEQASLKKYHRRIRVHDVIAQGGPCVFSRTNKRWVVKVKLNKELGNGMEEDGESDDEEEGEGDRLADDDDDEEEEEEEEEEDDDDDDERRVFATSTANGKSEYSATSMKAQDTWQVIKEDIDLVTIKHTPPTKINPANDAFYSCLLLTSSNGVPSMAYSTRTYARQQNDPLICLTSAIACFGRAQNRQVDNRHQVIVQGFAFLNRYRALRKAQGRTSSEVAYNFGRAFHLLGLYQLAVPHYEEVLQMHESNRKSASRRPEEDGQETGFIAWPEAAYNLIQIYLVSGNPVLANQVMERYLVV